MFWAQDSVSIFRVIWYWNGHRKRFQGNHGRVLILVRVSRSTVTGRININGATNGPPLSHTHTHNTHTILAAKFALFDHLPIVNYYKNGSIHRLAKRHGADIEWSHRCIDDSDADGGDDDDDDAFRSINCCDFPAYCSISLYWHRAKDRFARNQNASVDCNWKSNIPGEF